MLARLLMGSWKARVRRPGGQGLQLFSVLRSSVIQSGVCQCLSEIRIYIGNAYDQANSPFPLSSRWLDKPFMIIAIDWWCWLVWPFSQRLMITTRTNCALALASIKKKEISNRPGRHSMSNEQWAMCICKIHSTRLLSIGWSGGVNKLNFRHTVIRWNDPMVQLPPAHEYFIWSGYSIHPIHSLLPLCTLLY